MAAGGSANITIKEDQHCSYYENNIYAANSEGTWSLSEDNKYIFFNWNNPRTKPTSLKMVDSKDPSFDRVIKSEDYYLVETNGGTWHKVE
jgi:hypothetical protein